jgi:hypothetical protein
MLGTHYSFVPRGEGLRWLGFGEGLKAILRFERESLEAREVTNELLKHVFGVGYSICA